MKKLSLYIFLFLFFCSMGWTESSLSECKGSYHEKWTDCHGIETWENGRKYDGEFKDGKRHGHGTMTNPDGSAYIGQWKEGLPKGKGNETWKEGTKYEETRFRRDPYILTGEFHRPSSFERWWQILRGTYTLTKK